MKIAIDIGHGLGNRTAGVHDPGATHTENGVIYREHDIADQWARTLNEAVLKLRHKTCLIYNMHVIARASHAVKNGCQAIVSFHLNDAEDDNANGIETLYRLDMSLAVVIQNCLVENLKLRNRGVKPRPELAVLRRSIPSALIELGFIANDKDREALLNPALRVSTCKALAKVLSDFLK